MLTYHGDFPFFFVYLYCILLCGLTSDGGRVCRPLLVVEDGRTRLNKTHLDQMKLGVLSLQGKLQGHRHTPSRLYMHESRRPILYFSGICFETPMSHLLFSSTHVADVGWH